MSMPNDSALPTARVRVVRDVPPRPTGRYVLYWMRATRRTTDNFALDRAVELSRALKRPLLVLEALRCDYPWAADRHHAFVLAGMQDNAATLQRAGVAHHPYVEPARGHGRGLLRALSEQACAVVTDHHPAFHFPNMLRAAARDVAVRLEAVDSIGLMPLAAIERDYPTAFAFRALLQRELPAHLSVLPSPRPLAPLRGAPRAEIPAQVLARWPAADPACLAAQPSALAALPIDHDVPVAALAGGPSAGTKLMRRFVREALDRYGELRNHPDDDAGSGLSPYLHFGHVSVHAVLRALAEQHGWSPADLGRPRRGAREGFWGMPPAAEAFLDELVVWRELGHAFAQHRDDLDRWSSLPSWAIATLTAHAGDPRPYVYDRAAFEGAATHDPLWNAAQRQLVREGRIHNYMRMLWGKKVLHWTPDPQAALALLIELNNRWALDGRDPNSYSGIFWVLGRYDRPWGPQRPIFGSVRYMSSDATRRKLRVTRYLERYGEATPVRPRRSRGM